MVDCIDMEELGCLHFDTTLMEEQHLVDLHIATVLWQGQVS